MSAGSDPRRTFVVMLGGSKFSGDPTLNNERFEASAVGLRDYFLDPKGFGLPDDRNLLWLFDSPVTPNDVTREIKQFLADANQRPKDDQPLDVIVVYIGHGFRDNENNKRYCVVTPTYDPDVSGSALPFGDLQRTVKNLAFRARRFYVLDACYSGAAASETMSTNPIAHQVVSEVEEEAKNEEAGYGTALLCAASWSTEAMAPSGQKYTMFSGALLSILRDSDTSTSKLTFRQLHLLTRNLIAKHFTVDAVRPEIHCPDQKDGDIGTVELFPVSGQRTSDTAGVLDALDPATYHDPSSLHAVVVCRGGSQAAEFSPLVQAVNDAITNARFRDDIVAAANQCRDEWRAPRINDEGVNLAVLDLDRACGSTASILRAVAALCKTDIAVFDLTGWDAVATFLLGVRAVVRRGVTITSVGGDFTLGSELAIPFNLQLLNLVAHSSAQEERGRGKPFELIGDKIVNGFRDLANLPHYLDLPAYDSVRQIGVESGAYRPVRMSERILALCPFGATYTQRNFDRLEKVLPSCVQQQLHKSGDRLASQPALLRLLDLKTPRLIAQTLFESIRLTDMCVIDWTGARTNVIFEAGVRLAINPLGAVHIIEHGEEEKLSRTSGTLQGLLRLFEPIAYKTGGFDRGPFEQMVQRFEASVEDNARRKTNFVYAAVGAAIDRRSQPAALPLVSELMRSANLLHPDDQEGTGISPVLYQDVNGQLAAQAVDAAADRRLAAWLFMTRRYEPSQIASDPMLLDAFELLSFQVRRGARKEIKAAGTTAPRTLVAIVTEVKTSLDAVRAAAPAGSGVNGSIAADDLTRILSRAKCQKEEAKDLREDKNVPGAVQVLERAVALLSGAALAVGLDDSPEPGKAVRDLATQLADCLGMLGGNYRRLNELAKAQDCFERGRRYEESPILSVMSSYNVVNAIVTPIQDQTSDPDAQRSKLLLAVAIISRQVRGERRSDQWAWADLALCELLVGDRVAAMRSYARVRDLGGDQAIRSTIVPVLKDLRDVAKSRAADLSAAIEALSGDGIAAAESGVA